MPSFLKLVLSNFTLRDLVDAVIVILITVLVITILYRGRK